MPVQLDQRLINVDEYLKMGEAGILTAGDRVELIRGQIIQMSPIGSKHAACVDKIMALMYRLIPIEKAMIRGQNPVRLDDFSEPEPDIALLKPSPDYYAGQHPQSADILLIIEVADSSFEYDKEIKRPLYAAAGIPEYWIVNLEKKEIEAYREPSGNVYKHLDLFLPEDEAVFYGLQITAPARDMLV